MKKKTVFFVVLFLLGGSLFSSCAVLKHRDEREDMIMFMMLKEVSAMNANSDKQNLMYNQ